MQGERPAPDRHRKLDGREREHGAVAAANRLHEHEAAEEYAANYEQVYAEMENMKFNMACPVVAQQWIPSEENLAELQATVAKIIEDARA